MCVGVGEGGGGEEVVVVLLLTQLEREGVCPATRAHAANCGWHVAVDMTPTALRLCARPPKLPTTLAMRGEPPSSSP